MSAILEGAEAPTRIMYRANLSWRVLDRHLEFLERQGLMLCDWRPGYAIQHRTRIRLSIRGTELLKTLRKELAALSPGEGGILIRT